MNNVINIKIDFDSLEGMGFAAFGIKKNMEKVITFDLNAMLNCCVDNPEVEFNGFFKETFLHEMLHFIEFIYNKNFNHKRINAAIKKVQDKINV